MKELRVRIISQEKGLYRVSCEAGEKWAEVSGNYRYNTEKVSDFPTVGDYVIAAWPEDDSNAIITMLFPRKSILLRKAAGKELQEQAVAANIDTVFICMSLNNDFNVRRLERYLATVWDSGATPVILLTKKDLCEEPKQAIIKVEEVAAGVEILTVSALDSSYEELLSITRPGMTYAFVGSSGVGKSTLINRLTGEEAIRTGGLRNDDKGRHTTTHRELIDLPNGAFVIDTPGMREMGMWDHSEGIDTVFSEIEELQNRCRFSNCTHSGEPGCAVQKALEDGRLTPERWNAYIKLRTENAYISEQGDYLRAKKEKFKTIARINKANQRKH